MSRPVRASFVRLALTLALSLTHAPWAQAGYIGLETTPPRPDKRKPFRTMRVAQDEIAAGTFPEALVPLRYNRTGRPAPGKHYDLDGRIYRWREVHLILGRCAPCRTPVNEFNRHFGNYIGWTVASCMLPPFSSVLVAPAVIEYTKAEVALGDALLAYNRRADAGGPEEHDGHQSDLAPRRATAEIAGSAEPSTGGDVLLRNEPPSE